MKQPHLQTLNWISFQGLTRDKEGLQHLHLQSNLVKLTNCQHKDIRYIRIYKISLWFQGMVALCCFMLLYVPFPSFPQIDIWASNAIGLLPFPSLPETERKGPQILQSQLNSWKFTQEANQPCKHPHHP